MDIPLDNVVYFDFTTCSPVTAAAANADSTPTFAVYENGASSDIGVGGNATNLTTGLYGVTFTCSAANGFELNKWYNVVASATVGGIAGKKRIERFRIVAAETVVGYPVSDVTKWIGGTIPAVNVTGVPLIDAKYLLGTIFSTPTVAGIPNVNAKTWNDLTTVELPLVPTTAGRKLDVSAGGEAGVDWANVGSPTTVLDLSGTTIKTSQIVASVTGAVGSVTGAVGSVTGAVGSVTGNVGGNVTGSVGSVTGLTASDVAAIKTKTDSLTFTKANELDANIQSVNDVTVGGVGSEGNPWSPA